MYNWYFGSQENIDCEFEQAESTPDSMVRLMDKQQGMVRFSYFLLFGSFTVFKNKKIVYEISPNS